MGSLMESELPALHSPLTPSDQAAPVDCSRTLVVKDLFTIPPLMWLHIHQLFAELSANYQTFKDLGNNHIGPKLVLNYRFLNKEEKI